MAKTSGGEALAKALAREGVEVVFGIPGIQMYGIVAGIRDEPGTCPSCPGQFPRRD